MRHRQQPDRISSTLRLAASLKYGLTTASLVVELAQHVDRPHSGALLRSVCGALCSVGIVERLDEMLGKPVVGINHP